MNEARDEIFWYRIRKSASDIIDSVPAFDNFLSRADAPFGAEKTLIVINVAGLGIVYNQRVPPLCFSMQQPIW